MRAILKYSLSVTAVAMLMACGGGGDSDGGSTNNTEELQTGALAKYIGSYSYCDQDNTRYSLVLNSTGNNTLNIEPTEVTYQNSDCSGNVLGTYSWTTPATATLASTSVATVSGGGLPGSLTIDKIQVAVNNARIRLVGPAVTGNCVKFSNGNICYNQLQTNTTIQGGFYLSNGKLYELELENGTYFVSGIYSKN